MTHLTTAGARIALVLIAECLDERWNLRKLSTLASLAHCPREDAYNVAAALGLYLRDGTSGEIWVGLKDRQ